MSRAQTSKQQQHTSERCLQFMLQCFPGDSILWPYFSWHCVPEALSRFAGNGCFAGLPLAGCSKRSPPPVSRSFPFPFFLPRKQPEEEGPQQGGPGGGGGDGANPQVDSSGRDGEGSPGRCKGAALGCTGRGPFLGGI